MAAPGVRVLSLSDQAQQDLCKFNMTLKKLSAFSFLLPLLASSAVHAQAGEISDRAFSKWMKNSKSIADNIGDLDFSVQGTCEGSKVEVSFKSYGAFVRMKLLDKELILDESSFELPSSVDDLDQIRIMKHGKNDKLAIFLPTLEKLKITASVFYLTISKDHQSALLQVVDLDNSKDLEGPIVAACILSIAPEEAVSKNAEKPQQSKPYVEIPDPVRLPSPAPAPSVEPADVPAPAPAPAPVPVAGSAQ
jgi:hypothetical protein